MNCGFRILWRKNCVPTSIPTEPPARIEFDDNSLHTQILPRSQALFQGSSFFFRDALRISCCLDGPFFFVTPVFRVFSSSIQSCSRKFAGLKQLLSIKSD